MAQLGATMEKRLRARDAVPEPVPAYLPTAGSPLAVDKDVYQAIQSAPRVLHDSLAWYGVDARGGRVHDLLGARCDPYANALLAAGAAYDFHCHSNLARAVLPWGLAEADVHDVLNLFQVTGLDARGRYFMSPCPARAGDCVELLAEQDLLLALSTCPGGDLSAWGFDSERDMAECCRPLRVDVFRLEDDRLLASLGWKPAQVAPYKGMHGIVSPLGEADKPGTGN